MKGLPQMAINKLTLPKIKKLKFDPEGPKKIADGAGLSFVLRKSEAMLWHFNYRFDGKQKTISFCDWPTTTLEMTREKRTEARRFEVPLDL